MQFDYAFVKLSTHFLYFSQSLF